MVPNSFAAIATFLLLLAPGLIYNMARERLRPAAEESAFREASGIALASFLAGTVAIAILSILRAVGLDALPDAAAWVKQGAKYAADNIDKVAIFFVSYTVLAAGAAWLGAWLLFHSAEDVDIDLHTNAWFEAFRRRVPVGTTPMALVELENSTQYVGEVIYYAVNMSTDEREIMLGPPLWRRGSEKDDELVALPTEDQWRRVVIPGNRITSVWVRYPPVSE